MPLFLRCLLMVVTQESAQSLATLNGLLVVDVRTPREQQDIVLPLVIALRMVMLDIFAQRPPQRALAETIAPRSCQSRIMGPKRG